MGTKLWILSVLAIAMGCSNATVTSSSVDDVEDIVSMVARSDGNFDVVCREAVVKSQLLTIFDPVEFVAAATTHSRMV